MKKRLREIAIVSLLLGIAAGSLAGWMYYRARAQADAGMNLLRQSLRIYDQSDAVKGTPEENKLIEEGQKFEQAGNETISAARIRRQWALASGSTSLLFFLISVATIITHLKRKEIDSP
jgi:type II secretory pathway pseudopilin PulG